MFCGSPTWRRWKSAPAGNSSVSVSSPRRVGVASVRRLATGIERSRTASRMLRSHASVTCSSSTCGAARRQVRREAARRAERSPTAAAGGRRLRSGVRAAPGARGLEQLDAMCERLAREIRVRPGHLHDRQLERKSRVGALPHVLDGDREEVDEPQHGRLGELVRLLAKELLRLLGHRKRVGDVAHVLDEQQVPQVLEEVGDERGRDPGPAPRAPRGRGARRPCRGRRPCRRAAGATPRRRLRRAGERTGRRSSCSSRRRAGRASRRRRGRSHERSAR